MVQIPERSRWVQATNARPLFIALGITGDDVREGFARYRVAPLDGGDGAVDTLAVTTAADQCLVTAASTLVVQGREEMNGTAEMNLTYVAEPRGAVAMAKAYITKALQSAYPLGRGQGPVHHFFRYWQPRVYDEMALPASRTRSG